MLFVSKLVRNDGNSTDKVNGTHYKFTNVKSKELSKANELPTAGFICTCVVEREDGKFTIYAFYLKLASNLVAMFQIPKPSEDELKEQKKAAFQSMLYFCAYVALLRCGLVILSPSY